MAPPPVPSSPRVLGIDPGSLRMGWGVVQRAGNRYVHVGHGVATARQGTPLPERLRILADTLETVFERHAPEVVAMEQAFFHKDPHAALVLGHARGVAMLLAARRGLEVAEYPPATVKRAVVGTGKAEKAQVNAMMVAILGLKEPPALDASDALAVAVCHAGQFRSPVPATPAVRR